MDEGTQGWVRSSENIENPINTSLFIAAYGIGDVTVKMIKGRKKQLYRYIIQVKSKDFIESEDELLEWELYYASGQKLFQERADKSINRASISAAHMPKGVYIVRVKTANGTIAATKFFCINSLIYNSSALLSITESILDSADLLICSFKYSRILLPSQC